MLFSYGKIEIELPDSYSYVYYATFIVGEWDFLKVKKNDIVLDAGAFIGDFTVKVAKKAKEVVAVEPLPWAFKLLKKNVELNNLKNVVLVNKALYSVDGMKVKIKDSGVSSSITEEGETEVETITIDSLGKFNVVKMDIEGTEGELIKESVRWLDYVRMIAVELHGERNLNLIPKILRERGFIVREMTKNDLIRNTIQNITSHPLGFIRAEMKTKTLLKALKREYKVPALR
ncbi:FkbM family methyltransferase [Saccharolobus shibatae]|uniref:Putative SAM-dependent methyltransferase n=1 Tax=Saccharolobus shibatae TaxID=2286 RepID=A0A8F5GZ83_9CREN|nr:FkbM family methyltransferase [Saccharolobus shibatae]QXJ34875.1 putative SAM-dependent methyltransferase [Saccharolobus shibatae]